MADGKIDFGAIRTELGEVLSEALSDVVEGAAGDLKTFGADIATDMVASIAAGNTAMTNELKAQIRVLGAINKIRASNAAWGILDAVTSIAMRTVQIGLSGLTGGIV